MGLRSNLLLRSLPSTRHFYTMTTLAVRPDYSRSLLDRRLILPVQEWDRLVTSIVSKGRLGSSSVQQVTDGAMANVGVRPRPPLPR